MESEVEKCFSHLCLESKYNVIVMINRISAEWSTELVHPRYPIYGWDGAFICKTETSSLKSIIYEVGHLTTYLSDDFSIYPTFHCVYSFGPETRDKAKSDILEYYESIDPQRKMIKYNDYDLEFVYNG